LHGRTSWERAPSSWRRPLEYRVRRAAGPMSVRIAVREAAVDNLRSRREALVERRDAISSAYPLAVAPHVSVG
jgi:hypothetical protein